MEGKDHARIHTGRNDRNGRPRGSRRRTSLERHAAPKACPICTTPSACARLGCVEGHEVEAQTETRDESLDGVHPRDEG